jgi:hypothetical protein
MSTPDTTDDAVRELLLGASSTSALRARIAVRPNDLKITIAGHPYPRDLASRISIGP